MRRVPESSTTEAAGGSEGLGWGQWWWARAGPGPRSAVQGQLCEALPAGLHPLSSLENKLPPRGAPGIRPAVF